MKKEAREEFLQSILSKSFIRYNGYKISFRNEICSTLDVKLDAEKRYEIFKMFGERAHMLSWIAFSIYSDGRWSIFLYGSDGDRLSDNDDRDSVYREVIAHIQKVLQPEIEKLKEMFLEQVNLNVIAECEKIIKETQRI